MLPASQSRFPSMGVVAHCTTILGHMIGRQLLRPPGYEAEVEKVLEDHDECTGAMLSFVAVGCAGPLLSR
jgi:hypothetical protein